MHMYTFISKNLISSYVACTFTMLYIQRACRAYADITATLCKYDIVHLKNYVL